VLFALSGNAGSQGLYRKFGYREVGIFVEQGRLDGRFVDVVAMEKILKPVVLFVCRHNTGRSQMAEAFLRRFAGDDIEVFSAGTIPADRPNPGVVAAMAKIGIDLSRARPKLIDPSIVARADRIITMGCDVEGVPRVDDDWGLPDPKGQPLERVIEIRDLVCNKAGILARELLARRALCVISRVQNRQPITTSVRFTPGALVRGAGTWCHGHTRAQSVLCSLLRSVDRRDLWAAEVENVMRKGDEVHLIEERGTVSAGGINGPAEKGAQRGSDVSRKLRLANDRIPPSNSMNYSKTLMEYGFFDADGWPSDDYILGSPQIHTILPSRFSLGKRLVDYNLDGEKPRKAYG
jgi:arsenate reductase